MKKFIISLNLKKGFGHTGKVAHVQKLFVYVYIIGMLHEINILSITDNNYKLDEE